MWDVDGLGWGREQVGWRLGLSLGGAHTSGVERGRAGAKTKRGPSGKLGVQERCPRG